MSIQIKGLVIKENKETIRDGCGKVITVNHHPKFTINYTETTETGLEATGSKVIYNEESIEDIVKSMDKLKYILLKEFE